MSAWLLLGAAAHDLELLQKLMNIPCMLIAWIESHDPDVKKVRFTRVFAVQYASTRFTVIIAFSEPF